MSKFLAPIAALLASVVTPAVAARAEPLASGTYRIEPSASVIGFAIDNFWGVVTTHGQFNTFSGELLLAEPFTASQVHVNIDVKSVDTGIQKRDAHLRSDDFFAAEQYPSMTFVSSKVTGTPADFAVEGSLTIRDRTKPVTLKGSLDQEKGEFVATTQINRKEFGVPYESSMLSDEVMIKVNVKPRKG